MTPPSSHYHYNPTTVAEGVFFSPYRISSKIPRSDDDGPKNIGTYYAIALSFPSSPGSGRQRPLGAEIKSPRKNPMRFVRFAIIFSNRGRTVCSTRPTTRVQNEVRAISIEMVHRPNRGTFMPKRKNASVDRIYFGYSFYFQ